MKIGSIKIKSGVIKPRNDLKISIVVKRGLAFSGIEIESLVSAWAAIKWKLWISQEKWGEVINKIVINEIKNPLLKTTLLKLLTENNEINIGKIKSGKLYFANKPVEIERPKKK